MGLGNANTGIGLSTDRVWADGAAAQLGAVSTVIGAPPSDVTMVGADGVARPARLVQALGNTPAGYDVIPGWVAAVDVKVDEWVWCTSRMAQPSGADAPRGVIGAQSASAPPPQVVGTIDLESLAHSMAEVKDDFHFAGTVKHPKGVKK